MEKLISIITVCRNASATLPETMQSVLAQSYNDYEYIVIDGASTDSTISHIAATEERFSGRMKWVSEADSGIYDAMNKGIRMASGEIIGFLNADDHYADAHVLRDIATAFAQDAALEAVHGNLSYINARRKIVRRWKGAPYTAGAFQRGWMPAHPTFYCKRACFERYGAFEPAIGSAADFELMLRFIEKHRIRLKYLPREFVQMRIGGSSTSGFRAVLCNTRQNQAAFRRNSIPCPWHYPISRFLCKI